MSDEKTLAERLIDWADETYAIQAGSIPPLHRHPLLHNLWKTPTIAPLLANPASAERSRQERPAQAARVTVLPAPKSRTRLGGNSPGRFHFSQENP